MQTAPLSTPATTKAAPLAGIAVAEIGGEIATRYCGRLFSTLGATVTRWPGEAEVVDPWFATWLDAGKTLAPDAERALDALTAAAPRQRLVIAGQTGAAVAAMAARLVGREAALLGITWFDTEGPYAEWRGNDAILQALTGVAFAFGQPEGPPILAQGYGPQVVGGVVGFIAGLAGLMNEGGGPSRIDVSVFEAALCFSETAASTGAATGLRSHRLGPNRFVPTYPCNIYPTTDGFVGVTALTPAQWASLARLIGRPELGAEPRYAMAIQRLQLADEMDALLFPEFARRPTAYWVEAGDRLRIPITPAPRPSELPRHEHWAQRQSFSALGGTGSPEGPTLPFRFSFDGVTTPRPAGGPGGPLQGVRVADFSMGWAGPLAARYLGDLGADVIKIESTSRPDWWRGWEVMPDMDPPPTELPLNFMAVNRNKRGLDLDVASPAGKAAAEAIVRACDLVIENQGPGVMDKLGLGQADQRRLKPGVVSVSMPPFGRTGPLAGLRAYGSTVEQASGMPFVSGHAAWPPCLQHVAYGDAVAGLYGAAASLIGLYGRETLGGAEIDLCQVECLFQLGAEAIIAEQALGAPLPRTGTRRALAAPVCVVPSLDEDEWLALAVDSDGAWRALCGVIGRDDLAAAYPDLAARKASEDEIEAAVADWAFALPNRDAAAILQAAGVPAAPAQPMSELSSDLQLATSDFWALQMRRYVGPHLTPHAPLRFDRERPHVVRPAPVLGEHTAEVLAELGIDRA